MSPYPCTSMQRLRTNLNAIATKIDIRRIRMRRFLYKASEALICNFRLAYMIIWRWRLQGSRRTCNTSVLYDKKTFMWILCTEEIIKEIIYFYMSTLKIFKHKWLDQRNPINYRYNLLKNRQWSQVATSSRI